MLLVIPAKFSNLSLETDISIILLSIVELARAMVRTHLAHPLDINEELFRGFSAFNNSFLLQGTG